MDKGLWLMEDAQPNYKAIACRIGGKCLPQQNVLYSPRADG